jgi:ABC-type phosphate/phosphonate transport system substrate-binding protein
MPAFAYELAHGRYGAEVRLQVVRSVDRFAIVVTRSGPGQPETLAGLSARRLAVPKSLSAELRAKVKARLDGAAPGWVEVPVESDLEAVRRLVETPLEVDGAVSSHVFSGPHDLVGDGRKELEYQRPGTLAETRVVDATDAPVAEPATHYYGCIFNRSDSAVRRIEELNGKRFAYSDETSTSGAIFPRLLLERSGVTLGRIYYAGGHPNAVQAVWDGKADAGSAFYSPPSEQHARDGTLVGDARHLVMRRMADLDARRRFLEEVRVLVLTDPIPNDVCVVRRGFPQRTWERLERSIQRFVATDEGKLALHDLVAGVAVQAATDSTFDGFRRALATAGMSAEQLMQAEEQKLERKRSQAGGGS